MSVEQGFDPRDFCLVAFGGAGPLHANALGKLTQSFPVVIPPSPGVLCAFGDATTTLRHELGRAFIRQLGDINVSEVMAVYSDLLQQTSAATKEQGLVESQTVGSNLLIER